jgi:hypothetical protein
LQQQKRIVFDGKISPSITPCTNIKEFNSV